MSSGNFASIIDLRVGPSIQAFKIGLWLHALPAVLLPFAVSEPRWMIVGAALIALSWMAFRHHPALGARPQSIRRIQLDEQGQWQVWLQGSGDQPIRVRLRSESIVHPRLLWLRFVDERGKRHGRLLLGDEAPPSGLRRLRARLATLSR